MFNSLTQDERKAALFLIALILFGSGINFLTKRYACIRETLCAESEVEKININTANRDALIGVPEIGEKIASGIIAYREKQGVFRELEELRNIPGITERRFEKIKAYLSTE